MKKASASLALGLCLALGGAPVAGSLAGCDMAKIAASSTIRVFVRASPAINRYRDPDLAEAAIPASISQLEGVLVVKPESTDLRILLGRAYGSFGYGFLEDRMERAQLADDPETADHYRQRASLAYRRGREVSMEQLTLWEDDGGGAEAAARAGIDAWTRYLRRFDDADQAPVLFWAAYNWARYIGVNRDDVNAIADLPFVKALADRVLQLDRSYYNYAPVALHAGILASLPAALGGQPQEAKREIEEAIRLTERKNLLYLVTEAQLVAVALQDRTLYRTLLQEVLDASPDIDPDNRLGNLLAKRRAARMLGRIDDLFGPAEGEEGGRGAPAQGNCSEPGPNESFEDFDRRCGVSN
jgi:hypothetical protein